MKHVFGALIYLQVIFHSVRLQYLRLGNTPAKPLFMAQTLHLPTSVFTVYIGSLTVALYSIILISTVPMSAPSISLSNTTDSFAGALLVLHCDYTLNPSIDTAVNAEVRWMVNSTAIDFTSLSRISYERDSLVFSPLTTSDAGHYRGTLIVSASSTPQVIIQGPVQSAGEVITVQSKVYLGHIIAVIYQQSPFLSPPACCSCHSQPWSSSLCWYQPRPHLYCDTGL